MAKLNHLNIIKILPLPDPLKAVSTLPILCMEFCARGDLRKVKPYNMNMFDPN